MRFMKWLHPGLHIKRWLFLFGLGMMCSSFGIILTFNYQWLGELEEWAFRLLYEMTGHYNYTILASLGILVILLLILDICMLEVKNPLLRNVKFFTH